MKPDKHGNGNARLLHNTVKHIHEEREQDDLLYDVPNFEWETIK